MLRQHLLDLPGLEALADLLDLLVRPRRLCLVVPRLRRHLVVRRVRVVPVDLVRLVRLARLGYRAIRRYLGYLGYLAVPGRLAGLLVPQGLSARCMRLRRTSAPMRLRVPRGSACSGAWFSLGPTLQSAKRFHAMCQSSASGSRSLNLTTRLESTVAAKSPTALDAWQRSHPMHTQLC